MEMRRRLPIGVELVKKGIITETDIEKALEYQREHPSIKLGDILHILNVCDAEKLIQGIGEIIGEKGVLLTATSLRIKPTEYLSLEICKKNKCIPFEVTGGKIKVCFTDKSIDGKKDSVKMLLLNKGLIMEPYITFEIDIERILSNLEGEVSGDIAQTTSTGTIIELVDSIIRTGMGKRASDIHIEPLADEIRVRYRIDGQLFTVAKIPKEKQQQVIGRLKAISNMCGEKFVLRLLKKNENIKNIFELGYPGTEEDLKKSFNKKNSITIIAAPTGAGKTTTLYSIIDYLNSPEINPVEIRINGLNQVEIGNNKSTFSGALRTVLRQDPDMILLGEIRDQETAEIAIQAGQTGHYVLSTIHTIDAIEVINRMRKMGLSDYDISSTLATTVSQRLVRKVCPECKREREFTEEEMAIISKISEKYGQKVDFSNLKTYDVVGCKKCNNIGYYGRIGVFEILNISDEIKELIVKGASTIEIRNKALEQDYKPLVIDGINKVLKGYTTLDELNRQLIIY